MSSTSTSHIDDSTKPGRSMTALERLRLALQYGAGGAVLGAIPGAGIGAMIGGGIGQVAGYNEGVSNATKAQIKSTLEAPLNERLAVLINPEYRQAQADTASKTISEKGLEASVRRGKEGLGYGAVAGMVPGALLGGTLGVGAALLSDKKIASVYFSTLDNARTSIRRTKTARQAFIKGADDTSRIMRQFHLDPRRPAVMPPATVAPKASLSSTGQDLSTILNATGKYWGDLGNDALDAGRSSIENAVKTVADPINKAVSSVDNFVTRTVPQSIHDLAKTMSGTQKGEAVLSAIQKNIQDRRAEQAGLIPESTDKSLFRAGVIEAKRKSLRDFFNTRESDRLINRFEPVQQTSNQVNNQQIRDFEPVQQTSDQINNQQIRDFEPVRLPIEDPISHVQDNHHPIMDKVNEYLAKAKGFVSENKTPLMIGGGLAAGGIALKMYLDAQAAKEEKRKREEEALYARGKYAAFLKGAAWDR